MLATNVHSVLSPLDGITDVSPEESPILALVKRVKTVKQQHVDAAKSNKWDRYNPILIGGDLFTMGYLVFQGLTTYVPISASVMSLATLVCGVAAGAITLLVAGESLKQSLQAFHNGDVKLGSRLLLDFFGLLGIGAIMILTPLATKVAALACLTTFFAANPWVLPLLFFVITIPLLIEIGARITSIHTKKDLAADLKLNQLCTLLKEETVDWDAIFGLYDKTSVFYSELGSKSQIIERMETLQSGMGVTASLEAFKLLEQLLKKDKEGAFSQVQELQQKISEWNKKQHVRLLQQMLFLIAFIVSMVALRVSISPAIMASTENLLMAGANAIPLYMDTFWPFERNTTLVVPKVELEEVTQDV